MLDDFVTGAAANIYCVSQSAALIFVQSLSQPEALFTPKHTHLYFGSRLLQKFTGYIFYSKLPTQPEGV